MIERCLLQTAQTYNAAWTSDLRHVIRLICRRYANAPKIGCGFSMGGFAAFFAHILGFEKEQNRTVHQAKLFFKIYEITVR